MKKNNIKDISLRTFAGTIMAIVIIFFIFMAMFVTKKLHADNMLYASNGYVQLSGDMVINSPVYLGGQWEVFDDITIPPSKLSSLTPDYLVDFPLGSITQAQKDATYRLTFHLPSCADEELFLAIPTFEGDIEVFLNGIKQSLTFVANEWMPSSTLKVLIPLTAMDCNKEKQELIIRGDFSNRAITLFRRPIVMGTMRNITTLATFDGFGEIFAFGILIFVVVNGCVFMLFRPGHLMISLITLFDATILARIFFSLNFTLGLVNTIFPNLAFTDAFCRSAQFFSLMLGGIVGCILATMLYDPKKLAPRWLTWPAPIAYGLFALFFTGNMNLFEQFGGPLLICLYIYTFVVVFYQYSICWRTEKRRWYYFLQFSRTGYIGIVVFLDILFWSIYKDFSLLLYAYVIFFIMHVVVRLHDNNESYRNVEVLNQDLEITVAKRTAELSHANQVLSAISVRDPLTNTFNRLYLERAMEQALANCTTKESLLHVCIFDLDLFKKINDTYGHVVGDDVLVSATRIAKEFLDDDIVLARIGGEEFLLLFSGYSRYTVSSIVESIRMALEENTRMYPEHTTASFGISAWRPGDTQKSMLKKADTALYEAKNSGRNRIVFYKQEDLT